MGGKFSPIIILVLVVVVVVIGGLMFVTFRPSKSDNDENKNTSSTSIDKEEVKPILNLKKEYEGEEPKKVKIIAEATPNEGNEIKEIVLPDGSSMMGDKAEYEVELNGKYEFKVVCVDGTSDTLSIDVTEIAEISATNPYIPEGFTQVEGTTVEDGFIIEDDYGNQYVWIPVESGKLTRDTILDTKFEESATTASALVNSVAKYYGFYIGRYEASQFEIDGEPVAASMAGKVPWTNITYTDASNYASKSWEAFGYEDAKTSILNSYAWDTTLEWIDQKVTNYSSNINYGNYSGTIYPTGTVVEASDEMNGIWDLAGNVREWTTEIQKEDQATGTVLRVIRGGSATLNKSPASHVGYDESLSDNYWGFRLVLYR